MLFIGSPTYRLANMISKILKENYEFKKVFSIKNSNELVQKLKTMEINNNMVLATMDIKDMFMNIPIKNFIINKNK